MLKIKLLPLVLILFFAFTVTGYCVTELDYMEYVNDADAQSAYVTNAGIDFDTKLLIHFDGNDQDDTYTAETGQTVTFVNQAQLDTAQKEFGVSSLLVDGTGDYVTVPDSTDWDFATGNFTIEGWFRFNVATNGVRYVLVSQYTDGLNWWRFYRRETTDVFSFEVAAGGVLVTDFYTNNPFRPNTNQWYHLAIVRNGSACLLFIDGVSQDVTQGLAWGTMPNLTGDLYIGNWQHLAGAPFDGWIDEFRISKGVARWTSGFTRPATPYPILQCYSESTIKEQGTYSLKGIATITTSLNDTLTRTGLSIDLTDQIQIKYDIRGSRTGSQIKIGIHDSGGTTSEHTANIASANVWQTETWDISGVSNANKDVIDSIIMTIVNADAANTFYFDNMYAEVPEEEAANIMFMFSAF